ncbi:MAG: 2-hydroxychromene-2-carboxylate isomerase [Burkholderiales bacterium]|nr:MAG: 2-hydroxychromene-2-carboxylate isomerase [Burkholderiales bacterium]
MAAQLDFFYFIGSTYTYLSVMRIEAVAAASGIELRWRPFSVRTIMNEQNNVPFRDKPVKTRYMWRDIERRARRCGLPFPRVPGYPVDPDELANRVAVVACEQGWCPQYTRATYRAWFEHDLLPGVGDNVQRVLTGLGKDAEAIVALADSAEIRGRYDAETDVARRLGIFGSPTFACGSELFWGDDRLEDAIEWSQEHSA